MSVYTYRHDDLLDNPFLIPQCKEPMTLSPTTPHILSFVSAIFDFHTFARLFLVSLCPPITFIIYTINHLAIPDIRHWKGYIIRHLIMSSFFYYCSILVVVLRRCIHGEMYSLHLVVFLAHVFACKQMNARYLHSLHRVVVLFCP